MGEIVSAINCLCKVLHNLIKTSLKPEFFRLSKLNKLNLEETMQFWDLLHKLCCFSLAGSCTNDAKKCVTQYLLAEGTVVAYILPPEATPRQLLLCFGWLLSRGIIEFIIDKIILDTPLGKELPFKPDESVEPVPVSRPLENCPENHLNHAMYLSGLIQHNFRAISNHRQERAHLLAKLHKVTAGTCGLPHLSAGEVDLLSRPELVKEFLARCQHCITILETYSKWHKKSPVFWQWMDSVLEVEESLKSNNKLSDMEHNHLIDFSKILENNVRRTARLEDEDIAQKELELLFIGKMQMSEDRTFLDKAIRLLDSKIEIVSKISMRRIHELQTKLSSQPNSCDIDQIDRVLRQFGLSCQQTNMQSHLVDDALASSATQALSKLTLDEPKKS